MNEINRSRGLLKKTRLFAKIAMEIVQYQLNMNLVVFHVDITF